MNYSLNSADYKYDLIKQLIQRSKSYWSLLPNHLGDLNKNFKCLWDFMRKSLVVEMVKNPPAMQKTWVGSLGWEDPPWGGNGNPLKYPCLESPWIEEPGGLQSTGSQRVGHDLATKQHKKVSAYILKDDLLL